MRIRISRERLKRIIRALTPPEPTVGLEIFGWLDAADFAAWRADNPEGEVLETQPDGSACVLFQRIMTRSTR